MLVPSWNDLEDDIREKQGSLVAFSDEVGNVLREHRSQIKLLETQLASISLEAASEERYAASKTAASKEAQSSKAQQALDDMTQQFEAEARRSTGLSRRMRTLQAEKLDLRRRVMQGGRPAWQEAQRCDKKLDILAAKLQRIQCAVGTSHSAAAALQTQIESLRGEKAVFEAKLAAMQDDAKEARQMAVKDKEGARDAAALRDGVFDASRSLGVDSDRRSKWRAAQQPTRLVEPRPAEL